MAAAPSGGSGNWRASDDWYAHLLWIEGKKCVLFTHARTLFSFLVPSVKRADLRELPGLLAATAVRELGRESLSPDSLGVLDPDVARITTTASRRVLGTMNDMAVNCHAAVRIGGGLRRLDVNRLNHGLRRIPFGLLGMGRAIDRVREDLKRNRPYN